VVFFYMLKGGVYQFGSNVIWLVDAKGFFGFCT